MRRAEDVAARRRVEMPWPDRFHAWRLSPAPRTIVQDRGGGTGRKASASNDVEGCMPTRSDRAVNFADKLARIAEPWQPRVIAELNDYQFKIVRIEGDFVWHDHKETDEAFIVLEGELRIDFRDGAVRVGPGELYVVPKGVEHKPFAAREVKMLLIEPRGTANTGDEGGERTAPNDIWI
jgi:mannose-6-phosphate isomerase-like protein (cupin superfamily)